MKTTSLLGALSIFAAVAATPAIAADLVTKDQLDKDIITNAQKVVVTFKEQCTAMAQANIGTFGMVAKKLADVEKIPEKDVEETLAEVTKVLGPVVDVITSAAELLAQVQPEDTDNYRTLINDMHTAMVGCKGAHEEIELLVPDVLKLLDTDEYKAVASDTKLLRRVEQLTRHVIKATPSKFPNLAKEL